MKHLDIVITMTLVMMTMTRTMTAIGKIYKCDIFYSFFFFKLNILILVRVVKEMTKMQQAKDSKTEQIR